MDYRLKLAYEQMLKGESQKEQTSSQPKNLKEAYQTILTERTAFYAKDLGTQKDAPSIDGMENIGVIELETDKVKNAIKSFSILGDVKKLLSLAGWSENNKLLPARALAEEILALQIDPKDIDSILSRRSSLNHLVQAIEKAQPFKLYDELFNGFKATGAQINSPQENYYKLFDFIFPKVGLEGLANVGPGEILISIFTNSQKPEAGGDIQIQNQKIELKGTGAVLGYADYATEHLRAKMVGSLSKNVSFSREVAKEKGKFYEYIADLENRIKTSAEFSKLTPKLIDSLKEIYKALGTPRQQVVITKYDFDQPIKQTKVDADLIKRFASKKYIDTNFKLVDSGLTDGLYLTKQLRDILRQVKITAKAINEKGAKRVSVEDFKKKSLGTAVQDFFLTDLGLTSEQLAEVFYEARPDNDSNPNLLVNIKSYLTPERVHSMVNGNESIMKQFLFAIHLSEYARIHGFQNILLINSSTKEALALPASEGFTKMFEMFGQFKDKINFRISFGERGAYKISLI